MVLVQFFGCPAHDQRLNFALKYNLKIKTVVKPQKKMTILKLQTAYTGR